MGRNNDTFTLLIERNREAWSKFRRALRKEDQLLFDELWRAPKIHLAAGAFIANDMPLESIFMSMLLEQYKRIKQLEGQVRSQRSIELHGHEDAVALPVPPENGDSL